MQSELEEGAREKRMEGAGQELWAVLGTSPCLVPLEPQFPRLCWGARSPPFPQPPLPTEEEEAEAQGGEG